MKRFCIFLMATVLLTPLMAPAQSADNSTSVQPSAASEVDQHLQKMTEMLSLTADQQAKLKPIVADFLDARQKVVDNKQLSEEERAAKLKQLHEKALTRARTYLTAEQNKKLDEMQQAHEQH